MNNGGSLWLFLAPATDTRIKKVEEWTPEDKPRRTRRTATVKVKVPKA